MTLSTLLRPSLFAARGTSAAARAGATAGAAAAAPTGDLLVRGSADPASLLGLQVATAVGTQGALRSSGLSALGHRLAMAILRNVGA